MGKGRVAAGEDQFEAVVGNFGAVVIRLFALADESRGHVVFQFCGESSPSANAVNSFVAGSLDNPGARKLWYSGDLPLFHRGRKGFLCALFGEVEISAESDQGGEDTSPLGTINCFNSARGIGEHTLL